MDSWPAGWGLIFLLEVLNILLLLGDNISYALRGNNAVCFPGADARIIVVDNGNENILAVGNGLLDVATLDC